MLKPALLAAALVVTAINAPSSATGAGGHLAAAAAQPGKSVGKVVNLTRGGNGDSSGPSITANGRTIVWTSKASNLVPSDQGGFEDAFMWRGKISSLLAGQGDSTSAVVAPNGRIVDVVTYAADKVAGDFSMGPQLARTQLPGASSWSSSGGCFGACEITDLSDYGTSRVTQSYGAYRGATSLVADGSAADDPNFIEAFEDNPHSKQAFNPDGIVNIYLSAPANFATGPGGLVAGPDAWKPDLSKGGRRLAYVQGTSSGNAVLVRNNLTGAVKRLSRGNGSTLEVVISGNGKWVFFTSTATNLVRGQKDVNGTTADLYMVKAKGGKVRRIVTGDADIEQLAVDHKGKRVVFTSTAKNLTKKRDKSGVRDVFVWKR